MFVGSEELEADGSKGAQAAYDMVWEGASRYRRRVLATDTSGRQGARCLDGFADNWARGGENKGIALANTAELATPA